jgi:uncharacterized protein (TIGR00255 family)
MEKIYSLTGFAEEKTENFKFTIKSYNHRFLEIYFQMPDFFQNLEQKFKNLIQEKVRRGKIYVKIELNSFQFPFQLKINKKLLKEFVLFFKEIDPKMQYFPFSVLQKESFIIWEFEEDEKILKELETGFNLCFDKFLKSREEEGEKLRKIILKIAKELKNNLAKMKKRLPELNDEIFSEYKRQIETIFENFKFDEERIAQEAALIALKVDAMEEVERAEQFTERIIEKFKKSKNFQGKEIDFLTQEILRELQTFSQKVKEKNLREAAISCKLLNEQIREQVQNLE